MRPTFQDIAQKEGPYTLENISLIGQEGILSESGDLLRLRTLRTMLCVRDFGDANYILFGSAKDY
jgi:hypothetical protein